MPKDYNDVPLKIGDRVTIEFEVTDLFPNETHVNARLKSVIPKPDDYTYLELWGVNTHITKMARSVPVIIDEELFIDGCCKLNDSSLEDYSKRAARLPMRATRETISNDII